MMIFARLVALLMLLFYNFWNTPQLSVDLYVFGLSY